MLEDYLQVRHFAVQPRVPLSWAARDIKFIQLQNGILALLISDRASDWVSSALSIASGSNNDPKDVQGIAHLCEHLIHLGPKQNKESESFHDILLDNNGSFNAFTTDELTSFQFQIPLCLPEYTNMSKRGESDVSEPACNRVLSRFAEFFKNPKFCGEKTLKEVAVIGDEHNANTSEVGKIFFHGLRLLANPKHPFSNFSTGNFYTLRSIPNANGVSIRKEVYRYYQNNYIPRKMVLVLRGPQSLNHLQRLAILNFASIPIRSCPRGDGEGGFKEAITDFSILLDSSQEKCDQKVFTQDNLGNLIFIKSPQDTKVRFMFFTGNIDQNKKNLYTRTWVKILGDESEGSLARYLIDTKGFVSELYLWQELIALDNEVLFLELTLNNQGVRFLRKIMEIVFSYIKKVILNASYSEMGYFLAEMALIEKINYLHLSINTSAMDECCELSEILQGNLGIITEKNIIRSYDDWSDAHDISSASCDVSPKWWRFQALRLIREARKILIHSNCNLLIMHHDEAILHLLRDTRLDSYTFLKDINYDFEYVLIKNVFTYLKYEETDHETAFKFPPRNRYLFSDLKTLDAALENTNQSVFENQVSLIFCNEKYFSKDQQPELISFSSTHEVWFIRDPTECSKSKLMTSFQINCLSVQASASVTMAFDVLCEIISNSLQPKLYQAEEVGNAWGIFPSPDNNPSISFFLSGHKDTFELFLSTFIQEIRNIFCDIHNTRYKEFSRARIAVRRKYMCLAKTRGIEKVSHGIKRFLEKNVWSLEERLDALDELSVECLSQVCQSFLHGVHYISVFLQGDLHAKGIPAITNIIGELTKGDIQMAGVHLIEDLSLKRTASYTIPPGKNYLYFNTEDSTDPFNTIFYYIQLGNKNNAFDRSLSKLIAHLLGAKVTNKIRQEDQACYNVHSGMLLSRTNVGIFIVLTSVNSETTLLYQEIEEAINNWVLSFKNIGESDFRCAILSPFLSSYRKKEQSYEGIPFTMTTYLVKPQRSSSVFPRTEAFERHKHCWYNITSRAYHKGLVDLDEVDLQLIQSLTKKVFFDYIIKKVFVNQKCRSSLSLIVSSRLSREQLHLERMKTELLLFLNVHGLPISEEELEQIMCSQNEDKKYMAKQLYYYFKEKDEGNKFLFLSLKEVTKKALQRITLNNNSIPALRGRRDYKKNTENKSSTQMTHQTFKSCFSILDSVSSFHDECRKPSTSII